MNLTEGQLFTIEALNKIDGFAWPDKAEFAAMDDELFTIDFYSLKPEPLSDSLSFGSKFWMRAYNGKFKSGDHHPDWRNSLITREQFDSVDGWVRNDGSHKSAPLNPSSIIDVKTGDGVESYDVAEMYSWSMVGDVGVVSMWRHHKTTKEAEMQPEEPKQPSIDELYSQYKTQRVIVESAKKTLADEMEAEDKLLEQIKAWNLEHGFDVRLLDESEEKPELVITDWRDLRVGDEIECIEPVGGDVSSGDVGVVTSIGKGSITADFQKQADYVYGGCHYGSKWTFIRRP